MDKSAIQEITKLALAADQLLHNHNAIIIPDGYKLQSLESLEDKPTHFKGTFLTNVISEFESYVNLHSNDNSFVYVDQETMTAIAIIDQGSQSKPQWGKHRAEIKLLKTTAYSSLLKYANAALYQEEFIDFAEDWQENIKFYFDDMVEGQAVIGTPTFQKSIKTLRRLKVSANASKEQSVGNFSASQSALESIEITASNDQLPSGFMFNVIPYEGFDQVSFNCQLRAINDDKAVKLKYRIGQFESTNEHIANLFRNKIIEGVKTPIFIGEMNYQN